MQTAAYIDNDTRETVRARSIAYLASEVPPGLTLAQHRRSRRARGGPGSAGPSAAPTVVQTPRYPDDPTGNYETTDGGW